MQLNGRAYWRSPPLPGDIVVAWHPHRPDLKLIKRVMAVQPDGGCILQGDNLNESTDSRTFGSVPLELILGRVTSRLP